eukprot:CAMPEP_0174827948 /NCGR_PEP_ID=MMETSP1114-20130205/1036_1 /TAXON_ID=312471 /ORGANISM="Neobodo designis, Strain CCAP 1951/1" /LENGTH=51 /DNA_ID=CAMNT_0016061637 /DNA_START=78 /DNA_END=230 /DNA_ORIENTATION=+
MGCGASAEPVVVDPATPRVAPLTKRALDQHDLSASARPRTPSAATSTADAD